MVKTFAGYKPTEADSYEGKPHVSDMHLVQKLGNHSVVPALVEPLSADDPWERALLVHWSHEWLKNYAKLKKLEMRRLNRTKVIEDVERESLLATRGVASGP